MTVGGARASIGAAIAKGVEMTGSLLMMTAFALLLYATPALQPRVVLVPVKREFMGRRG